MDPSRQIRLLIAPFFFILSIVLANVFVPDFKLSTVVGGDSLTPTNYLAILTIFIASSLPIGFIFNVISALIYPIIVKKYIEKKFMGSKNSANKENLIKVLNQCFINGNKITDDEICYLSSNDIKYYIIMFEQGLLYNNYRDMFDFQVRAHTAFMISLNIIIAIIVSLVIGFWVTPDWRWWVFNFALLILMIWHSIWSKNNSFNLLIELLVKASFCDKDTQLIKSQIVMNQTISKALTEE